MDSFRVSGAKQANRYHGGQSTTHTTHTRFSKTPGSWVGFESLTRRTELNTLTVEALTGYDKCLNVKHLNRFLKVPHHL